MKTLKRTTDLNRQEDPYENMEHFNRKNFSSFVSKNSVLKTTDSSKVLNNISNLQPVSSNFFGEVIDFPESSNEKIYSFMKEVIEASSNLMCLIVSGKIIGINKKGCSILGFSNSEELIGKDLKYILAPESYNIIEDNIGILLDNDKQRSLEAYFIDSAGKHIKSNVSGRVFFNEDGFSFILEGCVSEEKKIDKRERFNSFVFHDTVTGLPAYSIFEDRLEMAIARATRSAHGKPENSIELLVVLSICIERYKDIVFSLGKEGGEYILSTVGSRLVSSFRRVDTVSRNEGGSFLMLLENLSSIDDIEIVCRRIIALIKEDISYQGQNLILDCGIGISIFPYNALTSKDLIFQANEALELVRKEGRDGYAFYKKKE